MRNEDRRHGAHGDERDDQIGERPAQAGVQAGVRLVEEQRVAVREQQAPERHPVRLAAGQPGGHGREQLADAEHPGQLVQFRGGSLVARRPAV